MHINFTRADEWLKDNLDGPGARVVSVIAKDGEIVYEKSLNSLSRKERMMAGFIAKKQGKNDNESLQDYNR